LGILKEPAGRGIAKITQVVYIEGMIKVKERNCMDAFLYGMGTIGQIFPRLPEEPPPETSPWLGVGDAFAATGDSLRWAMKEFGDAQGIEQKAQL
jgi:hypothetical protein